MKTYSRIREGGRKEIICGNWQDRINAIKEVIESGSFAKIDGAAVDLTTAGAIVAVFDKLNPQNQARFASLPIIKMADLAWKFIK